MNPAQVAELRAKLNVAEGQEWEPYAGLPPHEIEQVRQFVAGAPFAGSVERRFAAAKVPVPERDSFPVPAGQ